MTELFDMIAGSETGAIIATTLVIPNDDKNKTTRKNKFYSEKAIEFFERNLSTLYHDSSMPTVLKIDIFLPIVGFLSLFAYLGTYNKINIDGFNERYLEVKDMIKLRKK